MQGLYWPIHTHVRLLSQSEAGHSTELDDAGCLYTRVFLHKMKKIKTPQCAGCNNKDEDLSHLLLHCSFYDSIRETDLPQYFVQNTSIGDI